MSNLMLLLWISVIGFLNVRADSTKNADYSKVCELCNDKILPNCPTIDPLPYNMTIYCQQPEDKPCTIGIGEAANESSDYMCLLLQNPDPITSVNIPSEDGINVISIVKEPQTTMLPLPLTMQMSVTETITVTAPPHEEIPDANKVNEILDESMHTTTASELIEMTLKPAQIFDSENQIGDGILPEMLPAVTEKIETITKSKEELERPVAEETDKKPMESMDYQNDAAPSDSGIIDVATPVTLEENQFEMEESGKSERDDVIKDIQILVEPSKENALNNDDKEEIMNASAANKEEIERLDKEKETHSTNDINIDQASVATNMQTCYSCTSTEDKSCVTKPTREISCKALEGSKNGCYTLNQDNNIRRGCTNELSYRDLEACLDGKNKTCLACGGAACNSAAWPQCYNCHSEESNPACARWSTEEESNDMQHWATLCPGNNDVCISFIDSKGATVRGCVAQTQQCAKDEQETCRTCTSELCNAGVFPKTRRRCHQCTGTDNCAEEQAPERALACPIYQSPEKDGCFLYVNDKGRMQRGCTSSHKIFEDCKSSANGKRCVNCSNVDACNSMPLMIEPTFKCSRCDTRQQNASTTSGCAWAQPSESLVNCHNRYLYYLEQTCQMIYQPDVELTVRGCSLDVGACEPTNPWCRTCNASACNMVNLQWEYCVQCTSVETPNCGVDATHIAPTQCGATVQPFETRGCYTSQSVDTNITTRGCISDLPEEGMKYCKAHRKLCSLCYEHGCNNILVSSSATHLANLKLMTLPLAIIMVTILKSL